MEREHDLGGAVPARGNIGRHEAAVFLWARAQRTSHAKVADLEIARAIDEQVAGLDVAVQHVGRMDVLEPTQ